MGPLSLAVGLLGAAQATREAQETLRLLIYAFSAWLCPFYSPSEQRLRVGGPQRRISLNFPAVQAALAQHWHHMSEGRVGAGCPWAAGQGNRWLYEGTKDCESTLDVEGTSQIRTFKGLPSLQPAIRFKGEDTPFGSSAGD